MLYRKKRTLGSLSGSPVQEWVIMDNNNIMDIRYRLYGAPKYQSGTSKSIQDVMKSLKSSCKEIVVLNHLPRLGKTYSLLEYLNNSENTLSLYVSDIHQQMEQMVSNFSKMHVIQGAAKICPKLNDENTHDAEKNHLRFLFSGQFKRNLACRYCDAYKNCIYNKQFDFPENNIILTVAKESLPNPRIHTAFDFIIFDENMVKAAPIEPTLPKIDTELINSLYYGSQISFAYDNIKIISESSFTFKDNEIIKMLDEDAEYLGSDGIIRKTIKEISSLEFEEKKKFNGVLPFMANLYQTVEWAKRCYNAGECRPKHYRPYLHDAFDLINKYNTNLIIANATFSQPIYNQIENQYHNSLPQIKDIIDMPVTNKNSYLLNYKHPQGRSCSRTGLEEYGSEIFKTIETIPRFCEKKGLKTGLITFPEYEDNFPGFDVTDHFVAHRGKNDFDKVDVLTILGTHNIPRIGLLNKNYAITGEYLPIESLKNWKTKTINGSKISVPQNNQFRDTRLYLLYDEHLQTILRSGAHIKDKKTVINFGYVPPGCEKILTYKTFTNFRQLTNGYLTKIYAKKR